MCSFLTDVPPPPLSPRDRHSMRNLEIEQEYPGDLQSADKSGCKVAPVLSIGGIGLLLIAMVAAVGGGGAYWCFTTGPCNPASATPSRASSSAPSSVIAADMSAEFSSGESSAVSTTRRLRRRASGHHAVIITALEMPSGATIDATKIIEAGTMSAVGATTYSDAVPAFIDGVAAHLKTAPDCTALTAADRSFLIETIARTMVRTAVKHELAKCHSWFEMLAQANAENAGWSGDALATLKNKIVSKCKAENIDHYKNDLASGASSLLSHCTLSLL